MQHEIEKILVDESSIQKKISEMGAQISHDFQNEELVLIWVINGALVFTADLIRHITIPLKIDCIRASHLVEKNDQSNPTETDQLHLNIAGQSVLLVDVVMNSGETLSKATDLIKKHNPKSIKTCILLNKKEIGVIAHKPDYEGFKINDHFVVGYGLDFAERYRHLPYIGVLSSECQNPPEWV